MADTGKSWFARRNRSPQLLSRSPAAFELASSAGEGRHHRHHREVLVTILRTVPYHLCPRHTKVSGRHPSGRPVSWLLPFLQRGLSNSISFHSLVKRLGRGLLNRPVFLEVPTSEKMEQRTSQTSFPLKFANALFGWSKSTGKSIRRIGWRSSRLTITAASVSADAGQTDRWVV